jgi:ankyrin repeat protein
MNNNSFSRVNIFTLFHQAQYSLLEKKLLQNPELINQTDRRNADSNILILASKYGSLELIKFIFQSPKIYNKISNINFKNEFGRTALMDASRHGHIEIVNLLLKFGADPRIICSSGETTISNSQDKIFLQNYRLSERMEIEKILKNKLDEFEKVEMENEI